MPNIDDILCRAIETRSRTRAVAVLLSGGVDSISVALAANRIGKKIHGYTFHLRNKPTYDSVTAKRICKIMNWSCTVVEVPTSKISTVFLKLHRDVGCIKKTHYECCFPFLYVYPKIKEREVLSGWGADGYYGLSKRANIHFKHTLSLLNEFRANYFLTENCAGLKWHNRIASLYKKTHITPYLSNDVRDFFWGKDWFDLNKPFQKHHVIEAFSEFSRLGKVRRHINLQLGAGIDKLFEETLLHNSHINFKRRRRVLDICRDWSNLK